jgi:hypothetical protein
MTIVEPIQGRRGVDAHGNRFLLNPRVGEFAGFFEGTHGAAFIRQGADIAFGAGRDGSIDHSTIAQSFCLSGEEIFRGYATTAGHVQLEAWADAVDAEGIDPIDMRAIEEGVREAQIDPRMSRIPGTRELVVFSCESGQPIVERTLETV